MNYRFVSSLLVASVLSMNAVQAAVSVAEIGSIQGKVLVNQGKGFTALAEGAALKAGDRVMVGKESAAVIAYSTGCTVSINEAKVVTVAKVAPCKAGAHLAMAGFNMITPVADMPSVAPPVFDPLVPILLIGGGVGACVLLGCFNGPPVSP